jgi:hypothetical protein
MVGAYSRDAVYSPLVDDVTVESSFDSALSLKTRLSGSRDCQAASLRLRG